QESSKNHFINQPNFGESKNYFEEFVLLFERVFAGDNRLIWHVGPKGDNQIKATYSVADQKNGGVQVMRNLNTDLKISAIGQSVIICSLCMVRDNSKIFFDAGLINDSKLLIAQKLGFSSLVVSKTQVMPILGTKLVVIDQQGNSLAQINIEKNQEVFFDERYNLIEFKTPLEGKEKIVSQTIKF
ncbi:MAG: hypothetical protein Q8P80_02990, partial [Candidatus Levybacteria bacterium]|nr:hypothetical protein [Candidatus Levybacteria bacterium]